MLKITKFQYIERWDALPPVLREAMFSPANGEIIWRVGEEHHLKEEQIAQIAGICGNIVMGFLHPEDLAKEIKTSIGIDERLAAAISREIDRKVFSPLRSEIEKVYSPAGPVIEEIKPPEAVETPVEKLVETPAAEEIKGEEITGEHKIDISEFKVISPEEKPFDATQGEPPAGEAEPPVVSSVEPPVPPAFAEKPKEMKAEEVELAILPKMEASPVEAEKLTEEAKPIIIHEEAEIKAVREPARPFSLGSVFGFFKKKETKPVEPPTMAEIEMETPEEPSFAEAPEGKPAKMVNYELTPPPENLPVDEKPDVPTPDAPGRDVEKEKAPTLRPEASEAGVPTAERVGGDNVIDLSSFEKK